MPKLHKIITTDYTNLRELPLCHRLHRLHNYAAVFGIMQEAYKERKAAGHVSILFLHSLISMTVHERQVNSNYTIAE
jgi:hypothetical protein